MDMNRRSVLVGLGTAAAGSGAVFGSGAFSSVEAGRTITVTVSDDDNGYVTISGNGDIIGNNSDEGELSIDLGSPGGEALNKGAITFENNVIGVSNNHPSGTDIVVSLDTGSLSKDITDVDSYSGDIEGSDEVTTTGSEAEVTLTLDPNDSGGTDQTSNGGIVLTSSDTAQIDVTVDSTESDSSFEQLVIIAQEDNTGA